MVILHDGIHVVVRRFVVLLLCLRQTVRHAVGRRIGVVSPMLHMVLRRWWRRRSSVRRRRGRILAGGGGGGGSSLMCRVVREGAIHGRGSNMARAGGLAVRVVLGSVTWRLVGMLRVGAEGGQALLLGRIGGVERWQRRAWHGGGWQTAVVVMVVLLRRRRMAWWGRLREWRQRRSGRKKARSLCTLQSRRLA